MPEPAPMESAATEAGFRAIHERHAAEILRYAIRCAGRREIAEEITNEAFFRLYQHRDQIDPNRAGAWLTTAVKNLATDHWRRIATEIRHSGACASESPDPRSSRGEECAELLRHPSLKAEHRACLTLHYLHELPHKDITSITGLTDNQVKNALQYGLKLLRKAVGIREGQ